ncbi:MAG: hypothetical protein CMB80_03305 [Flammeovirgaceae bacterium]|nr:hypothetical protein [Flammeovirgaceae bacterium]
MKIGDLVRWINTPFIGVVMRERYPGTTGVHLVLVHWADGGVSTMYGDELEAVLPYPPTPEVLDEGR